MPTTMHDQSATSVVQGDFHDHGNQYNVQGTGQVHISQIKYVYVPPYPISPRFTGQETYLEKLREYFKPPTNDRSGRRSFLLYGVGGIGKTQIALKFAEENADRFWIFWVDSSSVETTEEDIKSIADHPFAVANDIERSVRSAIQWLSHADHEWLLIFDNADGNPNTISKYVPPGMRGNILFTSRNRMMGRHISSQNAIVEVDVMTEEQAISLLLKSAMQNESSSDLIAPSRAIVKELYCFPLAVDQAGAAIANGLCNIYNYRELYAKTPKAFLPFEGASNYAQAAFTTFEMLHKAIRDCTLGASDLMTPQAAEMAIFILSIFGFFHNENISEDIIKRAAEAPVDEPAVKKNLSLSELVLRELLRRDDSGAWDSLVFRDGIRILCSFSLVKPNLSTNSYSVHPLIHAWSRDIMTMNDKRNKYLLASTLLAYSITFTPEDRVFRRDLIPHLTSWKSHRTELNQTTSDTDNQLSKFGWTFSENRLHDEAEELNLELFESRKRVLGEEHPDTLETMNNLASVYYEQGRVKEAVELSLQAAGSMKRVLGAEHLDTLITMHNLGSTYNEQGRTKEAEQLLLQVVESMRRVLGVGHPSTLRAMNKLAYVHYKQGHMKEGEQLQLQIIESTKRVLGAEHRDTLMAMSNLAHAYHEQGRTKDAGQLLLQVVELKKGVLGVEHPSTLTTMNNLAYEYSQQGRTKDAEEMQLQLFESRKRVLGVGHPDTLTTMNNLASTYNRQGRPKEAEELQLQVVESRKRVLGVEHPDTLTTMNNLASIYHDQGRMEEAEKLQLQTIESMKRALGPEHPDTLTTMNNLASTYNEQGRTKEAEELLLQVVELAKRVLGAEHRDTLTAMNGLASTYHEQGHMEKAEQSLLQVVESMKGVLGMEHPRTLTTMNNLGSTYLKQGRTKDAEELLLQVVESQKRVLGVENPDTFMTMNNLASTYYAQGRAKEAEQVQHQVVELTTRVLGLEHPHTLTAMSNLVSIQEAQLTLLEYVKRTLGVTHLISLWRS